MKKILKLLLKNKWIRNHIRYNHYLHLIIFWVDYYKQLLKKHAKDDFFNLNANHISLTVGSSYKLEIAKKDNVFCKSDNSNVEVDQNGVVSAKKNAIGKDSQAVISVYNHKKKLLKTFYITIVDWKANISKIEIKDKLPNYNLLSYNNGLIYFSISKNLNKTEDSFQTKTQVSRLPVLPARSSKMLFTPAGYFLIGERKIVFSPDLKSWETCLEIKNHGLQHMFDFYYDKMTKKTFVFAGEYSCKDGENHKVYRGIISEDGTQKWETILDFDSIIKYEKDNRLWFSARHIHNVSIDPFTGNLWIGTGDSDLHSKILYSTDFGDSFQILGLGSQEWRTLSIWFTKKYVYWNMDSHETQKIFRVSREDIRKKQSVTPKIKEGQTKRGVNYLVIDSEQDNKFPVKVGEVYNENEPRILNSKNTVIALDDKDNDFREEIAELANGSQWFHCWVKDSKGDNVLIMGASPEGNIRDMQGRVFGIKEFSDDSIDIKELISVKSKNHGVELPENSFTQLEPLFQDHQGYIYFKSRNTFWKGIYKTKLKL